MPYHAKTVANARLLLVEEEKKVQTHAKTNSHSR
jgi:hypothetical protein